MADPTYTLQNIAWYDTNSVVSVPVAGAETIYEGSLVGYDAGGDATPFDDSGPFLGVALETVANTTAEGFGTDADLFIRVAKRAHVVCEGTANLIAAAMTGVSTVVYATDAITATDVVGDFPIGTVFQAEDTMDRHGRTSPVVVAIGFGALPAAIANAGTVGTNVTAVEYSPDGYHHVTVLTLAAAVLTPTIPADAEAAGAIIYTFPAGAYVGLGCHMDITAGVMDSATNAVDVGVGSVIATGDVSVLGGTATFEDWLTGATVAAASSFVVEDASAMTAIGILGAFAPADSHVLHINVAGTWNNTVAAASVTGVITIHWTYLGA